MNEPLKHHYLPVFYLSRWAGDDGRICRFSRPYEREVKAKRVVPKGTSFEPRLYETRGLPLDRAQNIEKDFMSKLDSAAAVALVRLESGLPDTEWDNKARTDWSRFILAQMFRAPQDIAQLKSIVGHEWSNAMPELEATYNAERSESDPPTFREYLDLIHPGFADEEALSNVQMLMCHSGVCQLINDMHWLVMDVPKYGITSLTSDRPIWMTATLIKEDDFIVMPIGPRKLFTATVTTATQRMLEGRNRRDLVKAINKLVVQHAVKYVYGLNARALRFIQKHMATKRYSTLSEGLAVMRGNEILSPDSPVWKG